LDAAGLDTQLLDQGSTWFVGSAGMPLGRVYVDTTQAAAAATILATMKV
jgi:hypothetical protein